ncbi:MAG: hypothetical protein HKN41_07200, partial [Ilumatobacter sp.]|nr:hypothetical protein [Ilumatobacter sp.]
MTDVFEGPAPDAPEAATSTTRRIAPLVVGVVAVVLAALVWILAGADEPGGASSDSPLLGRPAPASVGMFADGTTFELSRRKGSWVVLNFFTHNCVPCIR